MSSTFYVYWRSEKLPIFRVYIGVPWENIQWTTYIVAWIKYIVNLHINMVYIFYQHGIYFFINMVYIFYQHGIYFLSTWYIFFINMVYFLVLLEHHCCYVTSMVLILSRKLSFSNPTYKDFLYNFLKITYIKIWHIMSALVILQWREFNDYIYICVLMLLLWHIFSYSCCV
jgi:hypothetical protein